MGEIVQASFDYASLDAHTGVFLQETAQEIRKLIKRSAEDIVMIGIHLDQAKERLGHGKFMPWVQSEFAMSQFTAVKFMRVASLYAKFQLSLNLPASVLYELAAPSTPEVVIEQVQSGEIPPTIDAIKEAKEARKRAEQAAITAQRQLTQAQEVTESLTQQIASLRQEMASMSKPIIQTERVTPPGVKNQIATLQTRVNKLTEQRDNLAKETERLGEQARQATLKRNEEEREARIRADWQKITRDFQKTIGGMIAQIPTPEETDVFYDADWQRLNDIKSTAWNFFSACEKLKSHPGQIVDAG